MSVLCIKESMRKKKGAKYACNRLNMWDKVTVRQRETYFKTQEEKKKNLLNIYGIERKGNRGELCFVGLCLKLGINQNIEYLFSRQIGSSYFGTMVQHNLPTPLWCDFKLSLIMKVR